MLKRTIRKRWSGSSQRVKKLQESRFNNIFI
jgi:hypothetical protein